MKLTRPYAIRSGGRAGVLSRQTEVARVSDLVVERTYLSRQTTEQGEVWRQDEVKSRDELDQIKAGTTLL